jgi:SPP1 family predicted phage head-tail adaptor
VTLANTAKHKVQIQRNTPTQDSYGAEVDSWSSIGTRYAEITPLRGTERQTAQQQFAEADIRIRVRWDSTISGMAPKDRVYWVSGDKYYDVESVLSINEGYKMLEIMARQVV